MIGPRLSHSTATDANWKNSRDWLSQEPIGKWFGVNAAGRVTALWLSNNLRGELPPELGMAKLKQLWLNNNQLLGELPPELGSLAELKQLRLKDNQLSGQIPAEVGRLATLASWCSMAMGSAERYPPSLDVSRTCKRCT